LISFTALNSETHWLQRSTNRVRETLPVLIDSIYRHKIMLLPRLTLHLFTLFLSEVSVAQNGDKAGQTSNVNIIYSGDSNCNRINLSYYNASSSITVDAFTVPDDVPGASVVSDLTSLMLTMGVSEGPSGGPPYPNFSVQSFRVTPSPYIGLESSEVPYIGCSNIISSLTSQVNPKGQGDNELHYTFQPRMRGRPNRANQGDGLGMVGPNVPKLLRHGRSLS
jgi:hypothetical protein